MELCTAHPDASLAALAADDRSEQAFELLVRRYEARLFGFLLRKVGDRQLAEELTQDTFARAHTHMARYDPKYSFSTWLFTIANRLAISYLRRKRPILCEVREFDAGTELSPREQMARKETRTGIWDTARAVLPERQYTAVVLFYREDCTVNEVARIMGLTQTYVKVLLHRARKKLARHLPKPEA